MARANRREVLAEGEVQVVHCVNRCVRRGFLCGDDPISGQNYDHRRQWIRNRLEFLASVFGIEVLGFSVMSNHFHCVLRTRPDVVETWSDEEVARRWWQVFPQRRNEDGSAADPTKEDLRCIYGDKETLAERRKRLSSVSWFMRCTSEVIARMANAEDECTGRFWEGRFKSTVLGSEEAIAACMAYVDLNPIRAGIADKPENSDFTSVQERMADVRAAEAEFSEGSVQFSAERANKKTSSESGRRDAVDVGVEHGKKAGWLSPIALEPPRNKVRDRKTNRRASNKGCLPMTLAEYLQLVDWTGRQLHSGKRGYIKSDIPPLLERLGTSVDIWLNVVKKFERRQHIQTVTPAIRKSAAADSAIAQRA